MVYLKTAGFVRKHLSYDVKTDHRKYSPQLAAFPVMLTPRPRYRPFAPSFWTMPVKVGHIPRLVEPVATWKRVLRISRGFSRSVDAHPAPIPLMA
jgi:hypothetical protein